MAGPAPKVTPVVDGAETTWDALADLGRPLNLSKSMIQTRYRDAMRMRGVVTMADVLTPRMRKLPPHLDHVLSPAERRAAIKAEEAARVERARARMERYYPERAYLVGPYDIAQDPYVTEYLDLGYMHQVLQTISPPNPGHTHVG